MKKLRKYWPILAVLCFAAVIYAVFHTTVPFSHINESNVKEVAYETMYNGYQPLPEEDRQLFIESLREIRVMGLGLRSLAQTDGGSNTEFRIILTDGTQYFVAHRSRHLVINKRAHVCVGEESREKLGDLYWIFQEQPDHYWVH